MSAADAASSPPLALALRAAALTWQRFRGGQGLDRALAEAVDELTRSGATHPRLAAAAKDIAYTAARQLALLDALIASLASRPPAAPVAALLAVSLSQLMDGRHAEYVVVDQAVAAAKAVPDTLFASGFINGVLRNFLRQRPRLLVQAQRDDAVRFNLPAWWLAKLREQHPRDWRAIAQAQQGEPPLVLRVNTGAIPLTAMQQRLRAAGLATDVVGPQALWLHTPRPVEAIDGFRDGLVSVQDAGAQLAATWLDARDGMRVLDACAAPGGKTAHLAELVAAEIDAIEIDPARAARIDDNLKRLAAFQRGRVQVRIGDAADPAFIASLRREGAPYDRILLDAPCTASGIVRRHPDVPWLRRRQDVAQLATQQRRLLEALWPLLAPTGRLLYVVCSLFAEEGEQQIDAFLARHPEAQALPLPGVGKSALQLLPSALPQVQSKALVQAPVQAPADRSLAVASAAAELPRVHDGFFYALIEKR